MNESHEIFQKSRVLLLLEQLDENIRVSWDIVNCIYMFLFIKRTNNALIPFNFTHTPVQKQYAQSLSMLWIINPQWKQAEGQESG